LTLKHKFFPSIHLSQNISLIIFMSDNNKFFEIGLFFIEYLFDHVVFSLCSVIISEVVVLPNSEIFAHVVDDSAVEELYEGVDLELGALLSGYPRVQLVEDLALVLRRVGLHPVRPPGQHHVARLLVQVFERLVFEAHVVPEHFHLVQTQRFALRRTPAVDGQGPAHGPCRPLLPDAFPPCHLLLHLVSDRH
jgi:hypothetical protein